ncbi:MAG: rhodanese-like domain-containing protein [Anaerolineales bacterium]
MKISKHFLLLFLMLILTSLACNASLPTATPTLIPTLVLQSTVQPTTQAPSQGTIPLIEAEVPRIPVDQAKAAFDAGKAIIIDVRSPEAFAAEHVKGAINISLGVFETEIQTLPFDKNQWIITYCT